MRVAVLVKQVPDPAAPGGLDALTRTVVGKGALVLDPADLHGVEAALRLTKAEVGSEVVLVLIGPGQKTSGVRTGLAMGAAGAVIVSDDAVAGSDDLATAKVLTGVVRRLRADLVVTAAGSTDASGGVVLGQVAELLGWPAVTGARRVAITGVTLRAERQGARGRQDVECPLPCVVSLTSAVGEPRYPSFRDIVNARTKPVDVLTLAELALIPDELRSAAARQEVVDVVVRRRRRTAGEVVTDNGDAEDRILAFLRKLGLA